MKTIMLLLLFILSSRIACPQQDSALLKLYSFVENATAFTDSYPQEKVYLHFDNSSYFLGETVWFKAYVVTAAKHEATDVSRTLYVELLSPEGDVLETRKLLIENGRCHGEFSLQAGSRYSGFYQVRAYTRYMLNFGDACVFSRVFPVYEMPEDRDFSKLWIKGNKLSIPNKRKELDKPDALNVVFFPEGGNLVKGLESKIAFKATDRDGMNVDVTGTVYNSKKEAVATFQSLHRGMGSFYLTPTDDGYYAEVKASNGKKDKINLPGIQPEGYVMTVQRMENEIQASIRQNTGEPAVMGLVSLCRGQANAFAEVDMTNNRRALVKIPLEKLETGINQLTLYDRHGRALCERLVFVNHKDKQLEIRKTQNRNSYSPFEKIDMEFEVRDNEGNPVETDFSLSVRDAGTTTLTTYADNILTNLLLSSELKGYIENPSYYFESDDGQHQAALDLLLLTQGWRRYVWEQMAGIEDFQLVQPAEKGILIDGVVKTFTRNRKKQDVDISIILQNDSLGIRHESAKTDENGRFSVYTKDIKGDWDIVIQMKEKNKKKDYQAMLNRLFGPMPLSYKGYETKLRKETDREKTPEEIVETPETAADTTALSMSERDHRLPQVTVKARQRQDSIAKINIAYDVAKELDRIIDDGDYVGSNLMEFLLKTNRNFSIYDDAGITQYYYLNQPAVFAVNGKIYPNFSYSDNNNIINNISLNEVDTLEFISRENHQFKAVSENRMSKIVTLLEGWGDIDPDTGEQWMQVDLINRFKKMNNWEKTALTHGQGEVLINIKTYPNGKFRAEKKGIRHTRLQGYSYAKEFYSPRYNYPVYPDEQDFRRTLYWNPNVKTDATGKTSVGFYNNGACRKLNVSAGGLTNKGLPVVWED
jgi:hypothetical protein